MACKGDGIKGQVGETEFMEKLENIRMLLFELKSKDNKLQDELIKNRKLANDIHELVNLALTPDVPIEKKLLVHEMLEEAMPFAETQKRIASMFPYAVPRGKLAERKEK